MIDISPQGYYRQLTMMASQINSPCSRAFSVIISHFGSFWLLSRFSPLILKLWQPHSHSQILSCSCGKNQGRRPGTITTSHTGNGGLGFIMMALCPCNMRPVHTGVYKQSSLPRRCANSYRLRKYQVTNKQCVDTSGRRHACTSTERDRESSRLRSSTLLCVKQASALGHFHQAGSESGLKQLR